MTGGLPHALNFALLQSPETAAVALGYSTGSQLRTGHARAVGGGLPAFMSIWATGVALTVLLLPFRGAVLVVFGMHMCGPVHWRHWWALQCVSRGLCCAHILCASPFLEHGVELTLWSARSGPHLSGLGSFLS